MKVMVIEIIHYKLNNMLIKLDFFLKDLINNPKKPDKWQVQLTIANNCVSSIDNGEELVMHQKSDNIEIMISDQTDEVIEEFF